MVRKFILHTTYFTLVLGTLFFFFEIGLRNIPNNYAVKELYIDKNAGKTDILIVGNSHAFHGIDPDCLTGNAFNAANGSQSFKYDQFLFEKVLKKSPGLKYLILTVTYPSLSHQLEKSIENWRIKNYAIYHHYNGYPYEVKYHSEVLNGQLYVPITSMIDYYIKGNNPISTSGKGFFNISVPQENLEENGKKTALRHSRYDAAAWRINVQHLVNMLNIAKTHHMKVLIVSPPTSRAYYSHLRPTLVKRTRTLCDSLAKSYPETRYIDQQKSTSFQDADFFDADHLNTHGAKKFSMQLDSIMQAWQ